MTIKVRIEQSKLSPSHGRCVQNQYVAVVTDAGKYNGARYGATRAKAFVNVVKMLRERGYQGEIEGY